MADLPPHAQIRALLYAVRWETGIATSDLLLNEVEGERWLVWAASNVRLSSSSEGNDTNHGQLSSQKKHLLHYCWPMLRC